MQKAGRELLKGFAKQCQEAKVQNFEAHMLAGLHSFSIFFIIRFLSLSLLLLCAVKSAKAAAVEYAEQNHVDLIVVGTRGLGAVKSFFVGSFSQYILANPKCDVLLSRS